jgi:hypothetical protein
LIVRGKRPSGPFVYRIDAIRSIPEKAAPGLWGRIFRAAGACREHRLAGRPPGHRARSDAHSSRTDSERRALVRSTSMQTRPAKPITFLSATRRVSYDQKMKKTFRDPRDASVPTIDRRFSQFFFEGRAQIISTQFHMVIETHPIRVIK